nr:IS3 family transposase [Actibacterium sp. 188UL27-1]
MVCTKRRDIAEVFEFITANQAEYSVQMMSHTLGVSRSGFHAYLNRPPSDRQVADDALTDQIAAIHEGSKQTYGAPRIHAELADEGVHVGRKRIERLMKANGLRGVSRRKFVVTTERDPRARPASDLVDHNFYADAPNVLWVSDITYAPTWAGFLYLTVVLDAFSRRIIGWAIENDRKAQLVIETLFGTLGEARKTLEEWQEDYNWRRPHSALGNLTPMEFLQRRAMDKMAA